MVRGGKAHMIWGVFGGFVSSCSNLYGTDIQKYFSGVQVWINKGKYRSDSIICRLSAKTTPADLIPDALEKFVRILEKIQTSFHKSNLRWEGCFVFVFLEVRAWLEWRRGVIWLLWFLCVSELEPRDPGCRCRTGWVCLVLHSWLIASLQWNEAGCQGSFMGDSSTVVLDFNGYALGQIGDDTTRPLRARTHTHTHTRTEWHTQKKIPLEDMTRYPPRWLHSRLAPISEGCHHTCADITSFHKLWFQVHPKKHCKSGLSSSTTSVCVCVCVCVYPLSALSRVLLEN